jgi:hypothetical protein
VAGRTPRWFWAVIAAIVVIISILMYIGLILLFQYWDSIYGD